MNNLSSSQKEDIFFAVPMGVIIISLCVWVGGALYGEIQNERVIPKWEFVWVLCSFMFVALWTGMGMVFCAYKWVKKIYRIKQKEKK